MQNGNLHLPKKFGLYQRSVDLYLWRWIKDAEWKFTFTEEGWIIPTRSGFVRMKMNKRCRMEIYIYRRRLDYNNVRWICTYEDEEKMQNGNLHLPKWFWLYQCVVDFYLGRWMEDAEWKFTFTEEIGIKPTCGGFVPREKHKRCTMEIYIYRRSLDYTNVWWIFT